MTFRSLFRLCIHGLQVSSSSRSSVRKNSRMAKILVLTPRYPYPVVGGDRLRIYQVCRELAKRHELTLLSLCETRSEMTAPPPSDGVFSRVERIYLPSWKSALNALMALPTSTPLQIAYYKSRQYKKRLADLLPEQDVCLAHLIRMGEYVRNVSGLPRVLEMTDAISLNYQRLRDVGQKRNYKSWVYSLEAERLLNYEKRIIREFESIALVSETDRDFLLDGERLVSVVVCSNGVDLSNFECRGRITTKPVIGYIGNMTSLQNLDACLYFIEQVLPLLRTHLDVTFRVVGKIHEGDAARLRAHSGVEVTGLVPSVADAVADVRVGVCPVRIGAGVQNKVLEYMALGLPTVTSSIGLEGFSAINGEDVLVADSPEAYLAHIQRLWKDEDFAYELARNGRRYVESKHDWSARLAPLMERIDVLLRRDSGKGSRSLLAA